MISWVDKKLSCPSPEDLESEELRMLAKKLKGDSEKETLTNILEWQEKNIQYWKEKFICPIIFISVLLIILFSLFGANVLNELIFLIRLLVVAVFLVLLFLTASYWLHFREYQVSIREILGDTFRFSLPVDKILEYQLAVCKDYAKLTAALLFNIYPDSKVYFIAVPLHIAVMVKLRGRYYILDKKLPVLTMDKWFAKNNHLMRLSLRKIAVTYVSELRRESEGMPVDIEFKNYEKISMSDFSEKPINTEKLTKEVTKLLKISQTPQKEEPDFKITMPNFATYYEDDEIVIYSMARAIKNKLESEFCGNTDKISRIEITQNGKDLIVKVYLLDNY